MAPVFKTKEEKKEYIRSHQFLLTLADHEPMSEQQIDQASELNERDALAARAEKIGERIQAYENLAAKYQLPDAAGSFSRIVKYYLVPDDTPEGKAANEELIASLDTIEGRERFFDRYASELLDMDCSHFCATSDKDSVELYDKYLRDFSLAWPCASILSQSNVYLSPAKRQALLAKLPLIEVSGGIGEVIEQMQTPLYSTFTPLLTMPEFLKITGEAAAHATMNQMPDAGELGAFLAETAAFKGKIEESKMYETGSNVKKMLAEGIIKKDSPAYDLVDKDNHVIDMNQAVELYGKHEQVSSRLKGNEEIAAIKKPYDPEDKTKTVEFGENVPVYEPEAAPYGNGNLREYMKTLTEHISSQDGTAYSDFVTSVIKLNSITEPFYQPGPDGNTPTLTQADIQKISSAYMDVIQTAGTLPKGKKGSLEALQYSMASHIKDLASDDMAMLLSKDSSKTMTLGDSVEASRTAVVDVGKQTLTSSSGQLSARIPIEFTDSNGVQRKGFFTRETNFDPDKFIAGVIPDIREKYPEFDKYTDVLVGKDYVKLFQAFDLHQYVSSYSTLEEKQESFFTNLDEVLPPKAISEILSNPKGIEYFESIMIALDPYATPASTMGFDNAWLQLDKGANIDSRNSAMSSMANLLGVPNVIAHAEPMEIVVDGKTVKGTFMDNAPGKEVSNLAKDDPMRNYGPEVYDNPAVLKQLSDLQVLDYICGNIDRHEGNFFFTFDTTTDPEHPKCTGITGIDNDCSFGTVSYGRYNAGNIFIRPKDMTVISKSTADAVMSMDRSLIEATLKNYNLSKTEIDRCWERTQALQAKIKEDAEYFKDLPAGQAKADKIRIVNDDEWPSYHIQSLWNIPTGKKDSYDKDVMETSDNQYKILSTLPSAINRRDREKKMAEEMEAYKNASLGIVPEKKAEAPKKGPAKGVMSEKVTLKDPRFADDLMRMKHASLDSLFKKLEKTDPWYISSSPEFADMKKTLKSLKNINLGSPVNPDQLNKAKELNETLAAQAMSYIALKEGKTDLKDITLNRLTIANQILETTATYTDDGPKVVRNSHGEIVDFAPDTPASTQFIDWQAKHNKWIKKPDRDEYRFIKDMKTQAENMKEFVEVRSAIGKAEDNAIIKLAGEAQKGYEALGSLMTDALKKGQPFNTKYKVFEDSLSAITAFQMLYMERIGLNKLSPDSVLSSTTIKTGPIESVIKNKKAEPTVLIDVIKKNPLFAHQVNDLTATKLMDMFKNHREATLAKNVANDIVVSQAGNRNPVAAPQNNKTVEMKGPGK